MKYVTVGNCEKIIHELDASLSKDDDSYKVGIILLYGSLSGKHHSKTLFAKTRYPIEFIKKVVHNFKNNGIWENGKTNADYSNEQSGGAEFWLHVGVGLGYIQRAS